MFSLGYGILFLWSVISWNKFDQEACLKKNQDNVKVCEIDFKGQNETDKIIEREED